MAIKRTLRIVNYAVNGSGAGHVTRLVAVSRWLRRYAAWAGVRAEIYFLTSSEADALPLAERFAAFKLPSKTVVQDAGIDKLAFLALAKQWVWHSLGLIRPDLLVVDTFPRGSYGELLNALDLAKQRALIFRPMLEEFARRPDVQALLPLYDRVLIPEHEKDVVVPIPDAARARTRYVGPIAVRERVELFSREAARERLGLEPEARVVYVSAGGGGDVNAETSIEAAVSALLEADADLRIVVGAGPLYRGRVRRHPRLTWLVNETAAELARAFDVAVTAAGYNSFAELMLAGIPAVFVPQTKIADDQRERAERAVRAGAARLVEAEAGPLALAGAVLELFDPSENARASLAARALMPKNAARNAAAELLRLVLSAWEVDRAEAAVVDPLLAAALELGVEVESLLELMHEIDGESGQKTAARELGRLGESAARVTARALALGIPPGELCELSRAVLRRANVSEIEPREALLLESIARVSNPPDAPALEEPRQ